MGLIRTVAEACGASEELLPGEFRATWFGGKSGFFEGVRGIASFSESEVVLFLKKGSLAVEGEGLGLGRYCAGDLVITGRIRRMERRE